MQKIEAQFDAVPGNTLALALQITTRCDSRSKSKNNYRDDKTVLDAGLPDLLPNTQRGVHPPLVRSHLFPKQ